MGLNTKIAWTDHTWNPWTGCHKVSAGCANCYMFRAKRRWGKDPDSVILSKSNTFNMPVMIEDTGDIFVCSWSDFFIAEADTWRSEAWHIMKITPHLRYLILTKRPERVISCLPADWGAGYPNVLLGVTVEDNKSLYRIGVIRNVPTVTTKFISAEPLLSDITANGKLDGLHATMCVGVEWVIAGCESGPAARETDIGWVRNLRDFCVCNKIKFFLKQFKVKGKLVEMPELDGRVWAEKP
jgi:protein gp37